MGDKTKQGLLPNRYHVKRTDGSSRPKHRHANCVFFVLDFDHDPYAVPAALAYADACEDHYPKLAEDLRALVTSRPQDKAPTND